MIHVSHFTLWDICVNSGNWYSVWEFCRVLFLLGQFNLQRFVSSVKSSEEKPKGVSSWLKTFGRHLQQKSLYALGFSSEFQLGANDTLLFGLDAYDDAEKPRGKFAFHHKVSIWMHRLAHPKDKFCYSQLIITLIRFTSTIYFLLFYSNFLTWNWTRFWSFYSYKILLVCVCSFQIMI